jgi:hypothetical protein
MHETDQAGYTSVELAVEQKHEATVEVLLEAIVAAGMDIDARYKVRREQGQTLLMRASALGLTSTAAKLLALGADIAAKDADGKGAFDHTKEIKDEEKRAAVLAVMAEYSVLCAVVTGKADLVAAAVAKGCNMHETDQRCKTALDVATNDEVKAALRQGARHSLFYAAEQGMLELVADLIKEGADVNERDQAGNAAVERAQNAQTIDVLKEAGATMPEFPVEKKNNLLLEYAKKGATGGALMELQAGADVNHKDRDSATALHWAAIKGHESLAQGRPCWAQGRTSTRQTRTGARSTRPQCTTSPRLPRCCWRTGPKSMRAATKTGGGQHYTTLP